MATGFGTPTFNPKYRRKRSNRSGMLLSATLQNALDQAKASIAAAGSGGGGAPNTAALFGLLGADDATYTGGLTPAQQTAVRAAQASARAKTALSGSGGGGGSTAAQQFAQTYGQSSGGGGNGDVPTDPWTGFAGNFAPGGQPILEDDPQVIINEALKGMGFNPNSGMMALMKDDADALQWLAMLTLGTGDANSQDFEDYLNFANDYVKRQMTPGGPGMDANAMMRTILDAPEGSAVRALMEDATTPQEQANIVKGLMSAAIMGKTPLMRQAMQNRLEVATNDWLAEKAKGTGGYEGTLANFIQRGGGGFFGR